MQKVSELYVLLENKPGTVGELARVLKKKSISIYAIGLFIDTARLHVSDPRLALQAIQENGYQVELRDVLHAEVPNKPGVLMELTQKLGNAGININHLYGAMGSDQKMGIIIMDVDNIQLALDIFENHAVT
jgi:hypothetical protein